MKRVKHTFHLISYLQYPLMALGLLYLVKANYILYTAKDIQSYLVALNTCLIFMGLGISFSTFQDTTKTQNNFSKKMWESKRKGGIALIAFSIFTLLLLIFGFIGYFSSGNEGLQNVSVGFIILAIGFVGLIKTAVEMYENHRKD